MTTKDAATRRMVLDAIKVNMLFRNLAPEQQESIVDKMWLRDVPPATKIITQGELGDTFYVVQSGEFDIFKDGKQVAHRAVGTCFGLSGFALLLCCLLLAACCLLLAV
jgi:CRP-like cAMP-binding protein